MANNIVLLPAGGDAADQLILSAVANSITWAPTQYGEQGSAVYTGGITNGAGNALRGTAFTVTGFVGPNNNGTFLCESSTTTTLTLNNARATAETHAAVANYGTQSFPAQWSSKIENMYSNNQGDNISIETNGGETLVAIAIGLRSYDPFDLLHGTAPYPVLGGRGNETVFGFTQGLNDFNANPVITDDSLGTPATVTAVSIVDTFYSVMAATYAASVSPSPVTGQLGTAAGYALLGASAVTNSDGASTIINGGNIGSFPTNTITAGTPAWTLEGGTAVVTAVAQNQTDLTAAILAYQAMGPGTALGVALDSLVLTPGVYSGGTFTLSGGTLTLNGAGLYVFIAATTISLTAASQIVLTGGATAADVVFICGSSFTAAANSGTLFNGNILAHTSITVDGGVYNGRLLANIGAVTISTATTVNAPVGVPGPATWTLTGTFTGGASNAFAGNYFTVQGFAHAGNDGVFLATASSGTSLTLTNLDGVSETHAATASAYVLTVTAANSFSVGQKVTLTGMYEPWLDNFVGTILTESGTNFTVFYPEGTEPYSNPAEPACGENAHTGVYYCPLATPTGVNVWALIANINLIGSDYVAAIPPAVPFANSAPYPDYTRIVFAGGFLYIQIPPAPIPLPGSGGYANYLANQWQSSKWNLDGYYPSLYVWVATAVAAGTYNVNLNSVFQNGVVAPQDLAAGKAIFDGGVNFQVLKLQGTGAVEASSSIGITHANPATAPAPITTTATDGAALITVGLMKSGNVFAPGSTGQTPISLTLTSVTPLLYGPYSAPIREGGAVYTGTITNGANNAFVGYTFTVTGFLDGVNVTYPNGFNNGIFTCTASTATTLILTNGAAVAETHAAAAAYTPQMTEIANGVLVGSEAHYMVEYTLTAPGGATFNPGFQNPLGYDMAVASIAIKSN